MRASASSMGDDADQVAKIQVAKPCANHRRRTTQAMKAGSGEPEQEPGVEPGSVRLEPRTYPACGTKFFVTADREFCPVCILRRAFGTESAATGRSGSVSGSAASTDETDGAPRVRRFEHYEVMFDDQGRRAVYTSILVDSKLINSKC